MTRVNTGYYESLLETDASTLNEADTGLLIADDIFMYNEVNYLNNCLIILLFISHCFHIFLFEGDISPSISRFNMDYNGVFALILNILIPSIFFIQGWLKALEVHNYTSFFTRLHFEYLLPIFIYFMFYLISILFKNDTRLGNLTSEEFATLISQSCSFNPGFLSTFVILFIVNLTLDPIALVVVPDFYNSDVLISFTVDISSTNEFNMDENSILSRKKEKKHFSNLKKFSIYKLIYCLLMVKFCDQFLNFLSGMEPTQILYKPKMHNFWSVLLLFLLCKIFRKTPRTLYYIYLISTSIELMTYPFFEIYINNYFSTSLITTICFLSNIYLSGILISCMRLNIFNKWTVSIFFILISALCYFINVNHLRSVISPIICPCILNINSRFLTIFQIYSSVFAIIGLSFLIFKYIKVDSDSKSRSSNKLNFTVLFFYSVISCINLIKLME
ncbi:uncharacterized protein cubi_00814 [Cryptosporidium ubiquitum]|uniref:Uncharacterized protein n=1 Tax=Cryptosporidium ubiquitum TaxID=857276 RepID=A0A1J4M9J5_9CRYT|nr:uncharacterized protein cubi_00814 [Cryptosporidium ubiquitum]OII70886.1 hypothetical protein cubi_00814 [Cryptosporidium ubiquitum]